MAIYAKLLQIQKRLKAVSKDAKAYNYDYVSGDKLLDIVRPMMDEYGLLLLPIVLNTSSEPITYKKWDKGTKSVIETTEVLHTIKMQMRWVDTEQTEVIDIPFAAVGMNAFDKGFGSALTYAERYYLLKTFHISTSRDDVDAVSAERDEAIEKAQAVPQYKPLDTKTYNQIIALYCKGVTAKDGSDYRTAWIQKTNAGEKEIAQFDIDADTYITNNIGK
jgi:hypothetical protein